MSETPTEPEVQAAESTGDPVIDAALDRLVGLDGRPVHEHPAELEEVHRVLRDALTSAGRDESATEAP